MFLYAKIMLRSIEELDNLDEIRNELRVLPKDLDEAYGSSTAINKQEADKSTDMEDCSKKLIANLKSSKRNVDLFSVGLAAHQHL